jgi:hypothetical protein
MKEIEEPPGNDQEEQGNERCPGKPPAFSVFPSHYKIDRFFSAISASRAKRAREKAFVSRKGAKGAKKKNKDIVSRRGAEAAEKKKYYTIQVSGTSFLTPDSWLLSFVFSPSGNSASRAKRAREKSLYLSPSPQSRQRRKKNTGFRPQDSAFRFMVSVSCFLFPLVPCTLNLLP